MAEASDLRPMLSTTQNQVSARALSLSPVLESNQRYSWSKYYSTKSERCSVNLQQLLDECMMARIKIMNYEHKKKDNTKGQLSGHAPKAYPYRRKNLSIVNSVKKIFIG